MEESLLRVKNAGIGAPCNGCSKWGAQGCLPGSTSPPAMSFRSLVNEVVKLNNHASLHHHRSP